MVTRTGSAPVLAWVIAGTGIAATVGGLVIDASIHSDVAIRDCVLAVATLVVGARIASHALGNRYGWLLLVVGVLAAASVDVSLATSGPLEVLARWASFPSYAVLALSGCFFPDGALPSQRWRGPVLLVVAGLCVGVVGFVAYGARTPGDMVPVGDDETLGWDQLSVIVGLVSLLAAAVLALIAIVGRIRRASAADRGPLIWAAASTALLILGMVLEALGVPMTAVLVALAFPAAGVIAIARYGLYDIDTVVHRSLLYGTLTLVAAAIYATLPALVVQWTRVPTPFAAAVAALAVLPLHGWLQRLIDRWLYGTSGRPVELLTSLARGVGTALTPDDMLTAVVDGVAEGLRVPYVAVLLDPDARPERATGNRRPWPVTSLELVYRGARIGELAVQQRAPDEPWTRRERQLLDTLALQAAAPAAAVRLIRDLQQARERLVTTREEERRRLRKDLHDGVGPALSGARMQLRAALPALGSTHDLTALRGIEDDLGLASTELRRAIEGLRPPALDRGLAAALSGVVDRHAQTGLQIDLALPDRMHGVPAAVEVALYRVLDEALTNCVRHAGATQVTVRIERSSEHLVLTVTDDGRGYAGPRDGGVGTESMRQRCEELGGSLVIEPSEPHGTVLRATFGGG